LVIGVLVAIAIPAYNKYRNDAKATSSIKNIKKAFKACLNI